MKKHRHVCSSCNLISVIAKVKRIAEMDYDNKVYDHILSIFNKLTTSEKRVLLRGLINICFIVEDKVVLNSSDLDYLRSNLDRRSQSSNDSTYTRRMSDDKALGETEEKSKYKKRSLKFLLVLIVALVSLIGVRFSAFEPEIYDSISSGLLKIFKVLILL